MFAFHETTRKRMCRTAFIALCVAPTIATAAWIVDRRLPSRTATQAARLGGLLQTKAALTAYREPRPGSQRCDVLSLDDSTTGQPLVRLQGARLHGRGGAWLITTDSAAIDANQLASLAAKIAAWLCLPELRSAELRIDRLTIALPSIAEGAPAPALTLVDVQGRFKRDADGIARLQLAGRPVDSPSDDKSIVRFAVERSVANPKAATRATLESTSTALPASLLAAVVPGFRGLNVEATLTGRVEWTVDASGPAGAAKGRVDRLALSALLPAGSPHAVTGRATVSLADYRWRGVRLERLEAAATAEDVEASASLVAAAVKYMYCVQAAEPRPSEGESPAIALDRLACHFVLDHRGFTLFGDLPQSVEAPAGCLATSGKRPLLLQPPYVDVPAAAWIQFAAGPSSSWLPATDAAVRMASRLPLP